MTLTHDQKSEISRIIHSLAGCRMSTRVLAAEGHTEAAIRSLSRDYKERVKEMNAMLEASSLITKLMEQWGREQ